MKETLNFHNKFPQTLDEIRQILYIRSKLFLIDIFSRKLGKLKSGGFLENSENLKVGIMGGTFNPIHNGHLRIAETAFAELRLDKVLFVPNAAPPHKRIANDVAFEHRINMVNLAIANNPNFRICTIESFGKGEAEYTVNTLKNLRELFPSYEFYFITGADALIDMNKWKSPDEIFKLCEIVTTARPGKDSDELDFAIVNLRENYGARVTVIRMPLVDISSTQVREAVAAGLNVEHLVPPKVREYILEEELYV